MNDPVMFVLGLLLLGIIVLLIVDDSDTKMYDAPTNDEMTTVIPDPFAPVEELIFAEKIGRRTDLDRACDMPYVAKRYYGPHNYGPRTMAVVAERIAANN